MRFPKLWLAVAFALTGSAACSVDPLVPDGKGGTGGGAAGVGGAAGTSASGGTMGNGGTGGNDCGPPVPIVPCRVGRTVVECVTGPMGNHWSVSCPDDPTGAGGAAGASTGNGGAGGGVPCASTSSCAMGEVCSTENGVCNAPPGCNMGVACPAVCYGTCVPAGDGPTCGATRCAAGKTCCNSSCGICAGPNEGCTKQICVPPADGGACMTDSDCRLEADYCTGCDCRPLAKGQLVPPCSGPGVRCLRDPCSGAKAACVNGACAIQ
jgi:hypothetical protein